MGSIADFKNIRDNQDKAKTPSNELYSIMNAPMKMVVSRGGTVIFLTFMVVMILFFMGTCAIAVAQESPDAVPLLQGQQAPYDGVLLPAETLEGLLRDKVDLQKSKAEGNACRTELDITNKAYEDRVRKLTAKLDPGFWRQPETQRWIGFGLGIAVSVGAVWGAGQLK